MIEWPPILGPEARVQLGYTEERVAAVPRGLERLPLPAGREVEVELGCAEAWFLFERVALGVDFLPFLTLPAYEELEG